MDLESFDHAIGSGVSFRSCVFPEVTRLPQFVLVHDSPIFLCSGPFRAVVANMFAQNSHPQTHWQNLIRISFEQQLVRYSDQLNKISQHYTSSHAFRSGR